MNLIDVKRFYSSICKDSPIESTGQQGYIEKPCQEKGKERKGKKRKERKGKRKGKEKERQGKEKEKGPPKIEPGSRHSSANVPI